MAVWLILFFLVLSISFVLALRSMNDYQELPWSKTSAYALFLIRKPLFLTAEVLKNLHEKLLPEKMLLSLERLGRGARVAVVVYGPEAILHPLKDVLGLLELEDYSQKIAGREAGAAVWEMGLKSSLQELTEGEAVDFPVPEEKEEIFWQLVLSPQKNGSFKAVARALVLADNHAQAQFLEEKVIKSLAPKGLAVLPQPYSADQRFKVYQQRSIPKSSEVGGELNLRGPQIRSLLGIG